MFLYLIGSLLVLFTSYKLFKIASGTLSLLRLNLISWVFYFPLVLQSFIGINLAVFGTNQYLMSEASRNGIILAYLSICYVMLIMPFTMIVVQKYFFGGHIKRKINDYFLRPLNCGQGKNTKARLHFWIFLSILAAISTIYTYYIMGGSPIIKFIIDGNLYEYARTRISIDTDFNGNQYVKNIFCLLLAPFLSYIAYSYFKLNRRLSYRLWFYASVSVSLFALLSTGEKAPIIQYVLILFFIYGFTNSGVSKKRFLAMVSISLTIVVIFYGLLGQSFTFAVNRGPIGRILMTQIMGLPLTFDVFPHIRPFLMVSSFPHWITNLLGVNHSARSAQIIMDVFNHRGVADGTAGVINTLFIGESWANFGWLGLITSPIVVAVIIQTLHNILIEKKTPVYVALMGYFMFGLPVTGGFNDFIWNVDWITLFILVVISRVILGSNVKNDELCMEVTG